MPISLSARGVVLVIFAAASIGAATFFALDWVHRREQARRNSAIAALLAVEVDAYLRGKADDQQEPQEDLEQLADDGRRVCWVGVFNARGEGVEVRRRTALRREDIVGQIAFDAQEPVVRPLLLDGQPSSNLVVLTVPRPGHDATLAAVVSSSDLVPSEEPWRVMGCALAALAALAIALGWFRLTIERPIRRMSSWVSELERGASHGGLDGSPPEELRELVQSVEEMQRELRHWRSEAGELRYSLDARVDARTRQMARALQSVAHQADTDSLTKLLNRRALLRDLPPLFEQQRAAGQELAVVCLDMDRLKQLNDSCGHQAGDEAISFLGELLRATARRQTDWAVRHGGDEFALILPNTSVAEAVEIAKRLRGLFAQRAHSFGQIDPRPSISAGVAGLLQHRARSWQDLLGRADIALYTAKREGSGVAVYAGADPSGLHTSAGRRT